MQIKQLRLNTLENSRKSLARILKAFNAGDMEESRYRGLVYGMAHYLQYWKLEKDIQIEKELQEVRELLKKAELKK